MVLTALLFAIVSYAHVLDRTTGAIFIGLLIGYIIYAYRQERTPAATSDGHTSAFEKAEAYDELHDGPIRHQVEAQNLAQRLGPLVPLLMALGGLAIVVVGGKLLVDGAIGIARSYGMSETVIGLTIVAVGTSMPEFVTSVVAAIRKHGDVALGNIMGSNIYNLLGIGGVTALISPTGVPDVIVTFDNLVMIAASAAHVRGRLERLSHKPPGRRGAVGGDTPPTSTCCCRSRADRGIKTDVGYRTDSGRSRSADHRRRTTRPGRRHRGRTIRHVEAPHRIDARRLRNVDA